MREAFPIQPHITEKSMLLSSRGWYAFKVPVRVNSHQIAGRISKFYKVTVTSVRTMQMPGKTRKVGRRGHIVRTTDWKKALVRLSPGQTIAAFSGSQTEKTT